MVQPVGLEPTRPFGHKHLKLACLPIPTWPHTQMIGYFASLYLDRRFPLSYISPLRSGSGAGSSLPIKINVNASMVRAKGVEPLILAARELKSRVYANSTTPADLALLTQTHPCVWSFCFPKPPNSTLFFNAVIARDLNPLSYSVERHAEGLGLKSRGTPSNVDFGGLSWNRTMLSRLTVLRSTDELIAQIAI